MTDWKQRGGTVNAGMNLPPMDLNKEYLFELQSVEIKEGISTKFGLKNKVKMVWKEAGKETDYHRVWVTFNESYSEKSGLISFIRKVSPRPVLPGQVIKLGDYLDIGMKVLAYVQPRIDNMTLQPSGYYDFSPLRIKPAPTTPAASSGGVSVTLTDALKQHARGIKTSGDVFGILIGKVPNNIIQEFVAADKAGQIAYPIQ